MQLRIQEIKKFKIIITLLYKAITLWGLTDSAAPCYLAICSYGFTGIILSGTWGGNYCHAFSPMWLCLLSL